MKKGLLFLPVMLLLFACRKPHPDITTVQYEFTAGVSANYPLYYAVSNSTTAALVFNGTSWLQTVRVSNLSRPDSFSVARLKVYPPAAWTGATGSAHVSLTISINGEKKINVDTLLTGADTNGISAVSAF